jgi:hypothetical protein
VPNAFILLSHERSGSHFVGEYLSTLAGFRAFDEVCNPDAVKPTKHIESFFKFKHDAILKDPRLLLEPSLQLHRDFVKSYFAYLLSIGRAPNFVVDIKYGHVQNFEWHWWPILERPTLFDICESEDIAVAHLYRANVVEATVSSMIANRRKIWHSWQIKGAAAANQPVKLPAHEVARKASLLQRETELFRDWTAKNKKLVITYEQANAELGRGGSLDKSITKFFGAELKKPFQPRVQKLTQPLHEAVENFEELRKVCMEAGLGAFIKQETV